jgi:hypothetical protein
MTTGGMSAINVANCTSQGTSSPAEEGSRQVKETRGERGIGVPRKIGMTKTRGRLRSSAHSESIATFVSIPGEPAHQHTSARQRAISNVPAATQRD